MEKAAFIDRVLQILNESGVHLNGLELQGSETANVDLFIEKHYPAAFRRAVKIFPHTWFFPTSFKTATKITNPTDGTGYVILPDNYLTLSAFKMQGWKQEVLDALEATPQINKKQANEYLRGTPQYPVCVLRFVSTIENTVEVIKRALYYYSLPKAATDTGHIVELALYVANVTEFGLVTDVREQGDEALAWLCAATVLTTLEKEPIAKIIESKIIEMI